MVHWVFWLLVMPALFQSEPGRVALADELRSLAANSTRGLGAEPEFIETKLDCRYRNATWEFTIIATYHDSETGKLKMTESRTVPRSEVEKVFIVAGRPPAGSPEHRYLVIIQYRQRESQTDNMEFKEGSEIGLDGLKTVQFGVFTDPVAQRIKAIIEAL